jgi:ketosteroid isomerase-like protein
MTDNKNLDVINQIMPAIMDDDREALAACFTDDLVFRVRGYIPGVGDHHGPDGFLAVVGSWFELTAGDIKLEQLFAAADGDRAVEWERVDAGREGRRLETENIWTYRFVDGRIAEMSVVSTSTEDQFAAFSAH